jgi:hypothetical protein
MKGYIIGLRIPQCAHRDVKKRVKGFPRPPLRALKGHRPSYPSVRPPSRMPEAQGESRKPIKRRMSGCAANPPPSPRLRGVDEGLHCVCVCVCVCVHHICQYSIYVFVYTYVYTCTHTGHRWCRRLQFPFCVLNKERGSCSCWLSKLKCLLLMSPFLPHSGASSGYCKCMCISKHAHTHTHTHTHTQVTDIAVSVPSRWLFWPLCVYVYRVYTHSHSTHTHTLNTHTLTHTCINQQYVYTSMIPLTNLAWRGVVLTDLQSSI